MRTSFIVVPLATLAVAIAGSLLTNGGMAWYQTLSLPSFTPPGWIIGIIWTVIYILSAAAAMIVWSRALHNRAFRRIITLFIFNGIVNALWSYLFFTRHWIGAGFIDALLIEFSVLILIAWIWRVSKTAALLLVPYALWAAFASYLNWVIWSLNK